MELAKILLPGGIAITIENSQAGPEEKTATLILANGNAIQAKLPVAAPPARPSKQVRRPKNMKGVGTWTGGYTEERQSLLVDRRISTAKYDRCLCGLPASARGLCKSHYAFASRIISERQLVPANSAKEQDALDTFKRSRDKLDKPGPCWCGSTNKTIRGLCESHYQRAYKKIPKLDKLATKGSDHEDSEDIVVEPAPSENRMSRIPPGTRQCESSPQESADREAVTCLRCAGWFWSSDRITNRMCPACRRSNESQNDVARTGR